MNGLKCPKCGLVNLLNANSCHRCNNDLSALGTDAQVSVPVEETFAAQGAGAASKSGPVDSELGRKTVFWYRMYCVFMSCLYLLSIGLGIFLLVISSTSPEAGDPTENMITGAVYLLLGIVLLIVYVVGLFLPRKKFSWVTGIVLIGLGMTSCCLMPITIPLMIYWFKPETKAYFGA